MLKSRRRGSHVFGAPIVTLLLCVIPCIGQLGFWQPTGPVHGSQWGYLTIAVDRVDSNVVYTGTYHTSGGYQGIVFKTSNGGPPWTNSSAGLDGSPIGQLLVDRTDPTVVYARTYYSSRYIFKSEDGALNWRQKSFPGFGYANALVIARSDPRMIYAAGDKLYVSQDRGETWLSRALPTPWDAGRLAVSPFDPDVVFVSMCEYYDEENCNTRLYRSSNGGLTWSGPVLDPPGDDWIAAIEFDPLRPNVLYVSTSGVLQNGLHKTADLGSTWTFYSAPGDIREIEFDPRTPTTMYAVGVYNLGKSTDGGINWIPYTDGIPQFGPGFLDVDFSSDGRFMHAATSTGVYRAQVRDDVTGFGRVTGRVKDPDGRGVPKAVVSISDSLGIVRTAITNGLGYYVFDRVQTAVMYRMHVTSKGYSFADRIVTVDSDPTVVDFVAEPADRTKNARRH